MSAQSLPFPMDCHFKTSPSAGILKLLVTWVPFWQLDVACRSLKRIIIVFNKCIKIDGQDYNKFIILKYS